VLVTSGVSLVADEAYHLCLYLQVFSNESILANAFMALIRYKDDRSISTVIFTAGLPKKNERNFMK